MSFDWHKILASNDKLPRTEEVREFEEKVGFDLPEDYRNFLLSVNGGEITTEHDIRVSATPFDLGVWSLWPFAAASPGLGVSEARRMQEEEKWCLRQAVAIGDDGGTGHYYLLLAGEKAGAIFFIWLDDRPMLSEEDWETWEVRIPQDMIEVSPDFDSLGELILANARLR